MTLIDSDFDYAQSDSHSERSRTVFKKNINNMKCHLFMNQNQFVLYFNITTILNSLKNTTLPF